MCFTCFRDKLIVQHSILLLGVPVAYRLGRGIYHQSGDLALHIPQGVGTLHRHGFFGTAALLLQLGIGGRQQFSLCSLPRPSRAL